MKYKIYLVLLLLLISCKTSTLLFNKEKFLNDHGYVLKYSEADSLFHYIHANGDTLTLFFRGNSLLRSRVVNYINPKLKFISFYTGRTTNKRCAKNIGFNDLIKNSMIKSMEVSHQFQYLDSSLVLKLYYFKGCGYLKKSVQCNDGVRHGYTTTYFKPKKGKTRIKASYSYLYGKLTLGTFFYYRNGNLRQHNDYINDSLISIGFYNKKGIKTHEIKDGKYYSVKNDQ